MPTVRPIYLQVTIESWVDFEYAQEYGETGRKGKFGDQARLDFGQVVTIHFVLLQQLLQLFARLFGEKNSDGKSRLGII